MITARPLRNRILNGIVAVTVLIQIATVALPGLRRILGLQSLDSAAYGVIAVALLISVAGAFASARYAREPA